MKVYIVHSSDPADIENPFKAWMVVADTMSEAARLVPAGLVVSGIEFRRHEVPESLDTPQLLGWVGSKLPLVDPDDAPALLN